MRTERLSQYYHPALPCRRIALNSVSGTGDILTFGVFSGSSIAAIHTELTTNKVAYNKIWGFDSFIGLPKEQNGLAISNDWVQGSFNSLEWFGEQYKIDVISRLYKDFADFGIPLISKVELIDGFFSETLTDDLVKNMDIKPAIYIDIDSDLYISCCQVLDWVFRNKLYQSGTIIYYDDWLSGQKVDAGEYKAHFEFTNKYNIKCDLLDEGGTATWKIK